LSVVVIVTDTLETGLVVVDSVSVLIQNFQRNSEINSSIRVEESESFFTRSMVGGFETLNTGFTRVIVVALFFTGMSNYLVSIGVSEFLSIGG